MLQEFSFDLQFVNSFCKITCTLAEAKSTLVKLVMI